MEKGQAIRILVDLQGGLMHEATKRKVRQEQAIALLADQIRRLGAQDDLRGAQVGLEFVQRHQAPAAIPRAARLWPGDRRDELVVQALERHPPEPRAGLRDARPARDLQRPARANQPLHPLQQTPQDLPMRGPHIQGEGDDVIHHHTEAAAAAGIALINSVGNLGGFFGPYIVGFISARTGTFTAGVLYLVGSACIAGILVLRLRSDGRARARTA